jgi:hypothetical protein
VKGLLFVAGIFVSTHVEVSMKGLKARLHVGAMFGVTTAIGIAMSWTQALGQSTPDEPLRLPEPGMFGLFAAVSGGMLLYRWFKK